MRSEFYQPKRFRTGQALLVSGEAFADAVSASALAYREDIPIFLVSQADQGLMEIREDFPYLSSVIVIGGIERVSASVEACFPEVTRIAGTNRYETSRKVDEAFFSDQKQVIVTTGEDFADPGRSNHGPWADQ